MKKFLRFLLIFFLFFAIAKTDVYGQKKSRTLRKADTAFNLEEYSKAAELYKKAYKKHYKSYVRKLYLNYLFYAVRIEALTYEGT